MPYFALYYDVVEDYAERRTPYRPEHLELAREEAAAGRLLLGGGLGTDTVDGALLVFRTDDASAVEEFARRDPYVREGLVTRWHVRPWSVVVGSLAEGG